MSGLRADWGEGGCLVWILVWPPSPVPPSSLLFGSKLDCAFTALGIGWGWGWGEDAGGRFHGDARQTRERYA